MDRINRIFKTGSIKLFLLSILISFTAFGQNLPTATETAEEMTIGWNLGNTLEAIGGETAWGNPRATQNLIDSVKAAGFNTIRIPVAWDDNADQSTLEIDPSWMARVKEVVDYCINDDLYAILNIHWDGGWLEENCTESAQASVNEKQEEYWTQIAEYFKDYGGNLLFASANEPNVDNATQMAVLNSYHQTFIDAVRATGGNNSSRVLIIQGPSTDIEKTDELMNTLPNDNIEDRLMAEIHYYTPWNFCGLEEDADWGNMFYYWGEGNHSETDTERNPTWGEEDVVEEFFQLMKTKFVDQDIPVILGEYGAIKRTSLSGDALDLHLQSREYYYTYVTEAAVRYGLIPVYWDNGASDFALFDRNTGEVTDQGALDALMAGIGSTQVDHNSLSSPSNTSKPSLSHNPGTGLFSLNTSDLNKIQRITILDHRGRVVASNDNFSVKKGLQIGQDLRSGMYIVQFYNRGMTRSFKFIKSD